MKKNIIILFSFLLILGCNIEKKKEQKSINEEVEKEIINSSEIETDINKPVVFGIKGEDIEIRTGAGLEFPKVINEKTSKILKKTYYATVDYSVKVIVEEVHKEWSKIKVVSPSYLSNSHHGWILTKHLIGNNKDKPIIKKIKEFNNVEGVISKLSNNGIGILRGWKKDELGWYSFSDYYNFGSNSNGLQNNIAYYINSRQKEYVNEVKLVLNINNKNETKNALSFLNKLFEKTLKSLEITVPDNFHQNVLNREEFKYTNEAFDINLKLDKSKIETWNILIESK